MPDMWLWIRDKLLLGVDEEKEAKKNTMSLKLEGEEPITLITTPPVMHAGVGTWSISETERPGRKAVTTAGAPGLRTLSFEHRVWAHNAFVSCEELLEPFRTAAEKGKRVQFFSGGMWADGTWWWVRKLDVVEDAKATKHQTSRATLSWDCVEAHLISKVKLTKSAVPPEAATPTPPPAAPPAAAAPSFSLPMEDLSPGPGQGG